MTGSPKGAPGKQFGKYRLIAHLATGGMAEIFVATQSSLAGFQKLIVIKRILPNLSREKRFVEMFLDEARIAATLNHPNVVQIFDLGCIAGQYFIAMEYLPGESLSAVIRACRKRRIRLPHGLAAGMILQAAEGLHHAHTMNGPDGKPLNIVHRDVSPQNIFILYDGLAKVVDFGIAKAALRNTKTRTGTLKGKYAYMSPEQITGRELDARSDVFALGVVLWECLTLRKLYNQENDLELLQAVTGQDAPAPRSLVEDVPEPLNEITLKALARDREQRYQSAGEFSAALRGFLKSSAEEWDHVAIGGFMQELFSERREKKRALIESAMASMVDFEKYLFSDVISDTEISIPRSPPSEQKEQIVERFVGSLARKRRLGAALALLVVAVAGAAIVFALKTGARDDERPDAETTAGVYRLDAGTAAAPFVQSPGNSEAGGDSPDAGTAPADKGTRIASKKEPVRTKSKNTTRPKRLVVRKSRRGRKKLLAHRKATPGPPGKLRLATTPWTDVYYRDHHLGQTPLIDVELPSGRVKLRVVNREKGIDKTIMVVIKPGKRTSTKFNLLY